MDIRGKCKFLADSKYLGNGLAIPGIYMTTSISVCFSSLTSSLFPFYPPLLGLLPPNCVYICMSRFQQVYTPLNLVLQVETLVEFYTVSLLSSCYTGTLRQEPLWYHWLALRQEMIESYAEHCPIQPMIGCFWTFATAHWYCLPWSPVNYEN